MLSFFSNSSIRSPGPVAPEDVECEGFDVTYTRISTGENHHHHHKNNHSATASSSRPLDPHHPSNNINNNNNDIDQKVNQAIETFLKSLSQIGPELLSVSAQDGRSGWW